MNRSVVSQLILKDLRMGRSGVVLALLAGGGALALFLLSSGPAGAAGIVAFFMAIIMMGVFLSTVLVAGERKKQTLPFVMSLPVSPMQYTTAKLIATVGMFLVPWLALVGTAMAIIATRDDVPNGLIPLTLALATAPLVGFLITTSVSIVVESEGWGILVMAATNVSYSFVWLFVISTPGLTRDLGSPVSVWNGTILTVLGGELALVVLMLGLTFYFQSRKREFV